MVFLTDSFKLTKKTQKNTMQVYKDFLLLGLVYLIGTALLLGAGWVTCLVTA